MGNFLFDYKSRLRSNELKMHMDEINVEREVQIW